MADSCYGGTPAAALRQLAALLRSKDKGASAAAANAQAEGGLFASDYLAGLAAGYCHSAMEAEAMASATETQLTLKEAPGA